MTTPLQAAMTWANSIGATVLAIPTEFVAELDKMQVHNIQDEPEDLTAEEFTKKFFELALEDTRRDWGKLTLPKLIEFCRKDLSKNILEAEKNQEEQITIEYFRMRTPRENVMFVESIIYLLTNSGYETTCTSGRKDFLFVSQFNITLKK